MSIFGGLPLKTFKQKILSESEEAMKLFNKTSLAAIGAAALLTASVGAANAQTTVTGNLTIDQAAAVSFVQTTAMDLGEVYAGRRGGGGGAVATYVIGPEGANDTTVNNVGGATDDFIVEVTAGDRATFTITGGLADETVQIELPTVPSTLTCGPCSGTNPTFSVGTFIDDGDAGEQLLDGSGDAVFYVGATLSTVAGAAAYEEGTYTGTYDVTVTY